MMYKLKEWPRTMLCCIAFFIHSIIFYAIFDIYSPAPVKNSEIPAITNVNAPADRLVLFVADNFKLEEIFEGSRKFFFLHSLLEKRKVAWGVLHGMKPFFGCGLKTLLTGHYYNSFLYEWYNPINADLFLDHLKYVWIIGGELFSFTTGRDHIKIFLPKDENDFNTWSFNVLNDILNSTNKEEFMRSYILINLRKIIFSSEAKVIANRSATDFYIEKFVDQIENFFSDYKTTFIFTSLENDCNSMPFLVLGAGIQPSPISVTLNQADLAALQTVLLGTTFSLNGIGVFPLMLLNASSKYKFKAAYVNLKQLIAQYDQKRNVRMGQSLIFRDYVGFRVDALARVNNEIIRLANNKRFDAAAIAIQQWMPRVRDGILYFNNYHLQSLQWSLIAIILSWNVLLVTVLIFGLPPLTTELILPKKQYKAAIFGTSLFILCHRLPFSYFFYYLLPLSILSTTWNLNQLFCTGQIGEKNRLIWKFYKLSTFANWSSWLQANAILFCQNISTLGVYLKMNKFSCTMCRWTILATTFTNCLASIMVYNFNINEENFVVNVHIYSICIVLPFIVGIFLHLPIICSRVFEAILFDRSIF